MSVTITVPAEDIDNGAELHKYQEELKKTYPTITGMFFREGKLIIEGIDSIDEDSTKSSIKAFTPAETDEEKVSKEEAVQTKKLAREAAITELKSKGKIASDYKDK